VKKAFILFLISPIFILIGYIFFLWASTIHDSIDEGEKYGFIIGNSKKEAYSALLGWKKDHPELVVFTYAGIEGFTQKQYFKLDLKFDVLKEYNQWRVHIDGNDIGSNSIRLTFENGDLVNLYRHRQYYELP
jgi:hypothetical protein